MCKKYVIKNPRNNYTGIKYGKIEVICYVGHLGPSAIWKCKCDCGRFLNLRGTYIKNKKTESCRKCSKKTGKKHHAWKGCGDIPKHDWNTIVNSAIDRNISVEITIEDAWNQFKKQNGKCSLSGVELKFQETYKNRHLKTASLDRINSNKGYTKDNIQWIHRDLNYLKREIDNDKFISICKLVAKINENIEMVDVLNNEILINFKKGEK